MAAPRCPVCGEGLEAGPVRRCERCETPHHPECWEYVPGCAVFGCADDAGAVLPVADWPEAHALLLRGMYWVTLSARALQAVPLTFVLALVLAGGAGVEPGLAILPFGVAAVVTLVAMRGAFAVRHEFEARGLEGLLERLAGAEGDRRLARAVAERTGRTLPVPPGVGAPVLGVLATAVLLYGIGVVATPGDLARLWSMQGAVFVTFFTVLFYAALALPARWVGFQRIIANRLGAALEAGRPVKELPPR